MRRSRFFKWSVALLAIAALTVAGEMYWHFLREKSAGVRLADEGRHALDSSEFEKAIARFDAALAKPLAHHVKAEIYAFRGDAKNHIGATEAAIADLTLALELNPDRGVAYSARARAYQTKGEKEKAIEDYGAAITHGSSTPENYFARGTLFLESGQPAKAASDFTEVTQRAPENVTAFVLRGRAYTTVNDLEAAIASYDSALQIDPTNQEARAERGDLHSRKGDLEKAMADYAELRTSQGEVWAARSAQTSAPESLGAATDLLRQATIKLESGQFDRAIQLYNRLLQMNIPLPMVSTALQNRGNVYHRQGDDDRAMRDYEQAIRFNPANAGAYVNRGLIYATRRDFDAAILDYNEALRFDPKMHDALYNRALTHRDEGDLEAAERDLTQSIRLNAKFAPAYLHRAGILASQGKLDRAVADMDTAISNEPRLAEAYLVRAQLFARKHAYARELKDLEKAAQIGSSVLAQALNGRAWLRATCPEKAFRNGKKAADDALRACELTLWSDGGYVDTLAAAYAENGEFEKAANFQLFALTLTGISPESRPAAEKRAALYQSRRPYRDAKAE